MVLSYDSIAGHRDKVAAKLHLMNKKKHSQVTTHKESKYLCFFFSCGFCTTLIDIHKVILTDVPVGIKGNI